MKETKPTICFFDSGIGGLTLLDAAVQKINAHFVYFADNYNVPYGNLPPEKITALTEKIFESVAKFNPTAAVVACNTVTACCIDALRKKYSFPVIGIQPAVKPACADGGGCAVLATRSTAESAAFKKLLSACPSGAVDVYPCPDLAEYIENNLFKIKKSEVELLLPEIRRKNVVLGCTHYIYIKDIIREIYGCNVFDGVEGTVRRLICCIGGNAELSLESGEIAREVDFVGGDSLKNRIICEHMFNTWKFIPKNFN